MFPIRCLVALTLVAGAAYAQNLNYTQHNLVSDTSGSADNTDPNLTGLWGLSASPTSPFWVSNTFSGTSTLYNGTTGVPSATVVTVPAGASSTAGHGTPTGQVNNLITTAFIIGNGARASFIFSSLDGVISAWNGGTVAEVKIDNGAIGASYTGMALGTSSAGPVLYVADPPFGHVDVFDAKFQEIALPGHFVDPTLPGRTGSF